MNILFDLDGTLTDPADGIVASILYALDRAGITPPDVAQLRACIGPPLRHSFARLLGTDEPEPVERAVAHYREYFAPRGIFENRVYDGVPAMLSLLRARGARLFVATSKPQHFAERIIAHFGLEGFENIHGAALDGSLDDKRVLVRRLLERERLNPGNTWMVGDRSHDIIAARANRVAGLGVLYGYGTREELLDAGADAVADTATAVAGFLCAAIDAYSTGSSSINETK
jgi:phosphoglycolate phosphatase